MLDLVIKLALGLLVLMVMMRLCCALVHGIFCIAAFVGFVVLAVVPIVVIAAIARAV